jgi:hypothetical protein
MSARAKYSVEEFIEKAIAHVAEDRGNASILLAEIMQKIANNSIPPDELDSINRTAAKLLETLQRSNEQVVQLASIIQKQTAHEQFTELGPEDQERLLNKIQQNAEQKESAQVAKLAKKGKRRESGSAN